MPFANYIHEYLKFAFATRFKRGDPNGASVMMMINGDSMNLKRKDYGDAFLAWNVATSKYLSAMKSIANGQPLEDFNVDYLINDMAKCKSKLETLTKNTH